MIRSASLDLTQALAPGRALHQVLLQLPRERLHHRVASSTTTSTTASTSSTASSSASFTTTS